MLFSSEVTIPVRYQGQWVNDRGHADCPANSAYKAQLWGMKALDPKLCVHREEGKPGRKECIFSRQLVQLVTFNRRRKKIIMKEYPQQKYFIAELGFKYKTTKRKTVFPQSKWYQDWAHAWAASMKSGQSVKENPSEELTTLHNYQLPSFSSVRMLKSTPWKVNWASWDSTTAPEIKVINTTFTFQIKTKQITKKKRFIFCSWTLSRCYVMHRLVRLVWSLALRVSNKGTYTDSVIGHRTLTVRLVRAETLGVGVWLSGHLAWSKDNVYNV